MVDLLTKEKQALQKELDVVKKSVKGDSLKEELLKSKTTQDRLEQ